MSTRKKREIDRLIDTDFAGYKADSGIDIKEAMEKAGYKEPEKEPELPLLPVPVCTHLWHKAEHTEDGFYFFCNRCLHITFKLKP